MTAVGDALLNLKLPLEPLPTEAELRKAYKTQARINHPDKNQGDPDSAARFRANKEAFDLLVNELKRQEDPDYVGSDEEDEDYHGWEDEEDDEMFDFFDLYHKMFFGGMRGGGMGFSAGGGFGFSPGGGMRFSGMGGGGGIFFSSSMPSSMPQHRGVPSSFADGDSDDEYERRYSTASRRERRYMDRKRNRREKKEEAGYFFCDARLDKEEEEVRPLRGGWSTARVSTQRCCMRCLFRSGGRLHFIF